MRIKELDALRGLAALAVVFYHYTTQYGKMFGHTAEPPFTMPYGSYGVQLFFMISGFVIFLTLDRINKPMDFVISRASRLFPAYWTAIALTTAVVWTFGLAGEERDLTTTLINFSMIQGVFEIPDVDGVYWTLLYELIFYALMFGLFCSKQLHRIMLVIFLAVTLNIVNSYVDFIPWKIQLFLLLEYNHLFGAGILFYLMRKEGVTIAKLSLIGWCLLAHWLQGNMMGSIIVSTFFIVFLLFTYQLLGFLTIKPLIWLGSISYSLYLLHQNIGYVIIRELEAIALSPATAICIALILSFALAHFIMVSVERPAQKWLKEKYYGK